MTRLSDPKDHLLTYRIFDRISSLGFFGPIMNETKAEKLSRKCTPEITFSDLPVVLHDNEVASIVLYALKRIMRICNTAIIIKWNDAGFNDVATMPGCRNGVPGQTKAAIIAHIKEGGGANAMNLNTVFVFRNGHALTKCMISLLPWYENFILCNFS